MTSSSQGKPSHGEAKNEKKETKKRDPMASPSEVLGFVWELGPSSTVIFVIGVVAGVGNGMVYPALAYLFSSSFSDIGAAASEGMDQIKELSFTFLGVGTFALFMASVQTGCFELLANKASASFRRQWFSALLRQDAAYFDVYDVSAISSMIGPNANKFKRGLGKKFGEGIQFTTTFLGGLGYAFYSSWKVALLILAALPLCSAAAYGVLVINQTKGSRASKAYARAGSVAYNTVSAIKTVLSLNALQEMINQYKDATLDAYKNSVRPLCIQGFAFGSMLGSFIVLYCVLTLFGTFLLYREVEKNGCDPSAGVSDNESCAETGPGVFGAMLGVAFAAQGVSQVGNFFETFTAARVACYPAMMAINRKPGSEKVEIMETEEEAAEDASKSHAFSDTGDEEGHSRVKAILPPYQIDSSSKGGEKPEKVKGHIAFKNVNFNYPTRPNTAVLKNFSLEIQAGQTVALVGPSGGGKSTTAALVERFYDPLSGAVELDGIDLRQLNVSHLRSLIGYVGQEPTLFATSIRGNIAYGNPGASMEQIEEAAKLANAYDFIKSFPDGFETQCGDKGAQMSGGQKQRIAIARVLVANPQILVLDEATSALDSESELIVQEALDNVLETQRRTTIVIAHRLSTIRNADVIAVIAGGEVVELGTHDELMETEAGHYRGLVERQAGTSSMDSSRNSSELNLSDMSDSAHGSKPRDLSSSVRDSGIPHFDFKDVTFAYPTRPTKKVFDGFNLSIRSGDTVALVGPSGGGKSTSVALIERFYDVDKGSIEYLGYDVTALNIQWYRDQIGYVGQEPTLFGTSIAKNIAYGAPNATMEEIEEAAKQANAYDFIMDFPDGFDTYVGERGTQLSGGQKQRVAIARALVKKPKVLLLDEATAALDTQSESIVQEALDKLMDSKEHTTIVIAHRLSTIRNVDKIAFVADGKVLEYGSHEALMDKKHGRYRRLVETQTDRNASVVELTAKKLLDKKSKDTTGEEEEEIPDFEAEIEEETKAFSIARARQMAGPDAIFLMFGAIGSVMAGGVFPVWGIMFAETVDLLFRRVESCETVEALGLDFESCDDYVQYQVDDLRELSFRVGGFWVVVGAGCVFGNMLTVWGFGMASERMNKRVRDSAFSALVRQEVAYFDKRSVGDITSRLEEDAARIHTFTGEPIRSLLIALSSVLTGVAISFVYMWPFALIALACVPLMGFATSVEMKTMLGEDESSDEKEDTKELSSDELKSPGGIAVETLLNIRTVAALTLEEKRLQNYEHALNGENPNFVRDGFIAGSTSGLSMFIQQWVNALQLWWGGWLLFNHPTLYGFNDFVIAMFALLFSLFGLGAAFQGVSDKNETEKSAGRIFHLLDRESAIDPLSTEGKKLE